MPVTKVALSPRSTARTTSGIALSPTADPRDSQKVVVIGASTGGTQALCKVLEPLPVGLPGIAIVQHMPAGFTGRLASRLNRRCNLTVLEAEQGKLFQKGHAYIAPGGKHLTLRQDGDVVSIILCDGPELMGHKPSVDCLFDSVRHGSGLDVMAIMLTGMGGDGSAAMKWLHNQGALTMVQDEASCVVFGMPREAIRLGAVSHILPLLDIGQRIVGFGVTKASSRRVA
ncbi:MAG: chemotaxis protein CheB [bacterium]|nr:chemotaxis protein CheB [bacterium]